MAQASSGHSLSLTLKHGGNTATELRNLLQPYINHISSPFIHFVSEVERFALMIPDFLTLEKLTIFTNYDIMLSGVINIAASILQLPPTLRSLTVIGTPINLKDLSSPNPVWAHLTNVEIAISHPSPFVPMFRPLRGCDLRRIQPNTGLRTIHAHQVVRCSHTPQFTRA
ncbi:hypothetical protein DFH29DRAFT_911311 [Suillus ampliporus]|nr:hypothetical protein DFH29DRAFT_911311 [Suillus ampliporus]